jgi:hypothetical protein
MDGRGEMTMQMFGLVDLVIGGIIVLFAIIVFLVELPDFVRYMKMKSM